MADSLTYGQIIGRFLAIVGDSPNDPDAYPDVVPLTGKVVLTPSVSAVLLAGMDPAPATAVARPIEAELDAEGYLSLNGRRGVYVVATDSPAFNPSGFTYSVSFAGLRLNGGTVQYAAFNIPVPAGADTDLSLVAPVPASPGTAIVSDNALLFTTVAQAETRIREYVLEQIAIGGGGGGGGEVGVDPTARQTATTALNRADDAQSRADAAYTLAGAAYVLPGDGIPAATLAASVRQSIADARAAGDGAATAASDAAAAAATARGIAEARYVKPGSGIPLADLTAAIQALLSAAGTAVQPAALSTKADLVNGVLPTSQLPALALITRVPVANEAAMLALTASQVQPGDLAVRADGKGTWMLMAADPSKLANWGLLDSVTDVVTDVNGQVGHVVLGKADIGLGNVANLAPADLPVSTATATALAGKAATSHTHTVSQLSDASTVGKAVAVAADAATARAAVGAGTASTKADVGLGNVANLAPADLPVSTAGQAALDGKAASSHTHTVSQLSDATALGKSLATVADAASARNLIGAAVPSILLAAGATAVPTNTPAGTIVGYRA